VTRAGGRSAADVNLVAAPAGRTLCDGGQSGGEPRLWGAFTLLSTSSCVLGWHAYALSWYSPPSSTMSSAPKHLFGGGGAVGA
jgi:hypothetical protein